MKIFTSLLLALAFLVAVPLHAQDSPFNPAEDARFRKLEAEKTLYFMYDFGLNTGSSTAAISLGTKYLPAGAVVVRNYFYVKTPVASSSNTAQLAFACGSANLLSATTNLTNTGAAVFLDGVATGASTLFSASVGATACIPKVTVTVQPLTAGNIRGYIRYIVPTIYPGNW